MSTNDDETIAQRNARRALAYSDSMRDIFEKQQAAQQELTALLVSRLGKDIGQAIALLKDAGPYYSLDKELKEARKQANAQKKAATAKKAV